jgi:hypothetical protein
VAVEARIGGVIAVSCPGMLARGFVTF